MNFELIPEESVEEGSVSWTHSGSKSNMSKSPVSASSDHGISLISDIMLEKFDAPEEVTADGVKIFNDLQQ